LGAQARGSTLLIAHRSSKALDAKRIHASYPVQRCFGDGRLKIGCTGFGPIEDLMTGSVASSRSTKLGRQVRVGSL